MDVNQKMLAVLKELVAEAVWLGHDTNICSRTDECDDAESPEECSNCTVLEPCAECECGLDQFNQIVDRAVQIIDEAENGR